MPEKLLHSQVWEQEDLIFESPNRFLILAPSGSGKTTLVSLLYGINRDYRGVLEIDGQDSRSFNEDDWAHLRRYRLSALFQKPALFEKLTAWENLILKSNLSSGSESRDSLWKWAKRLKIDNLLDRPCSQLSMGECQRVALLRALAQPFEFLLMDEPFSHLDESNRTRAVELVNEVLDFRQAGLILSSLNGQEAFSVHQRLELCAEC